MSFYAINTAKAREGKLIKAKNAALALAAYLNENYDADIQVLANHDGHRATLHWVSRHDSWTDREARSQQTADDPKHDQLVAEINKYIDLFNSEWHFYDVVE